ncbi:MAG TPA: hypothetical protein DCR46_01480 [Cytophagales bacterium]|jgi:predicted Zn-dependent peptidase|nr:hypothetical protein [Cytophagales bacterium]
MEVDLMDIHKKMQHNSISLTFKGTLTFELIDSIVAIISNRLDQIESNLVIKKKVYGVMLECLQNLCFHVEKINEEDYSPHFDQQSTLFNIDSDEKGYHITTGNFVAKEKMENLKNWLDEINSLSEQEIKELYNKILRNKNYSEKGTGGLGFVDMAKKAGKLKYKIDAIDDKYEFFAFNLNIPKPIA